MTHFFFGDFLGWPPFFHFSIETLIICWSPLDDVIFVISGDVRRKSPKSQTFSHLPTKPRCLSLAASTRYQSVRRCCAAPLRTATQRKAWTSHLILLNSVSVQRCIASTRPYWYLATFEPWEWGSDFCDAPGLFEVNGVWEDVESLHGNRIT